MKSTNQKLGITAVALLIMGSTMTMNPGNSQAGDGAPHPLAVVKINHEAATMVKARSVPFHVLPVPRIGTENPIPVGARADTLLMAGMMNHGWDMALAH
ncbi:MAG: hypothetical protein JJU11_04590, partial [Candidatus Sumerlaeia bacterium]|nr:hypothetical protein [Candidatus Sumerlaeia bacterium]